MLFRTRGNATPGRAAPGTPARSLAPAGPRTRPAGTPWSSSGGCVTSGGRPAGSPSVSPGAKLRDVEGLVKLVDRTEIEANDWSLTPGRYVGVAPEEEDESFDFRTALREIHAELDDLNAEAAVLAAKIRKNFEELGM